jgi:hypothetical protein
MRLPRGESQDRVAIALARAAQGAQPIDNRAQEPDIALVVNGRGNPGCPWLPFLFCSALVKSLSTLTFPHSFPINSTAVRK